MNNGVELLSELAEEPDPETLGLVAQSAKAAGSRLQFYRVAYGLAGTTGPELTLAEALSLVEGVVVTARIALEGPREGADDAQRLGRPATKLLLNLLLLAAEALPRGGRSPLPSEGSGAAYDVTAEGDDARLPDDTAFWAKPSTSRRSARATSTPISRCSSQGPSASVSLSNRIRAPSAFG